MAQASQPRVASFRTDLRAATASSHERVDAAFSQFSLIDEAGYRGFLAAHHFVLPACENALAAFGAGALVVDWPDRVRTPALLLDMADIGVAMPGSMAPGASAVLGAAEAFGMMYVLEGSRLGGAILAKRLSANPVARCRNASRYLLHGDGLRFWPSFVSALEASSVVRDNPDAVIASAIATFALFENAASNRLDAAA